MSQLACRRFRYTEMIEQSWDYEREAASTTEYQAICKHFLLLPSESDVALDGIKHRTILMQYYGIPVMDSGPLVPSLAVHGGRTDPRSAPPERRSQVGAR